MDQANEKLIKSFINNHGLRKWARYMVFKDGGNAEDFQELFNKTVLDVWLALEKGTIIDNIEAYGRAVYKHNWIQLDKKNKRRRDAINQIQQDSHIESAEDQVISKERMELLWKEIGKMGDLCQKIFSLFYKEGLRYREIAEQLDRNRSMNWVKDKAYKCRNELRKRLEKLDGF